MSSSQGAKATAHHRVDGAWQPDTSGAVHVAILGPKPGTTAPATPQVAAELSAPTALVESGLWVDGVELLQKGGGLTPTRGTIYGAPDGAAREAARTPRSPTRAPRPTRQPSHGRSASAENAPSDLISSSRGGWIAGQLGALRQSPTAAGAPGLTHCGLRGLGLSGLARRLPACGGAAASPARELLRPGGVRLRRP